MNDHLVADYLEQVRRAGAALGPARLEELLTDLREHIAAARAELSPESEAGVRTLLARLGDPAAIVAAATADEPTLPATGASAPSPSGRSARRVLVTVVAVIVGVCLLGVIVVAVGLFAFRVEDGSTDGGSAETPHSIVVTRQP